MPTLREEVLAQGVKVAVSAPFELMWLLHFIESGHAHEGALAVLEPLRRELGPQLSELRDDGLTQYSTELVVLAYRSGTLLDPDLDRFFERFERVVADRSRLPSLLSERPSEREAVRIRIEKLRDDPARRRRYLDLLTAVWREVEPEWTSAGLAAATAEAKRWSTEVADDPLAFKTAIGLARLWPGRPDLDDLAEAAAMDGALILSPCWFGGKMHIVELDGVVYLGRGFRFAEPAYRKVAAEVASNMKALADPTRVAILLRLGREPASVTELARQLKLAQPTVSAHVQILRDAGLLVERAVGRSAELSASEEGLRRLFSRSEESLVGLIHH